VYRNESLSNQIELAWRKVTRRCWLATSNGAGLSLALVSRPSRETSITNTNARKKNKSFQFSVIVNRLALTSSGSNNDDHIGQREQEGTFIREYTVIEACQSDAECAECGIKCSARCSRFNAGAGRSEHDFLIVLFNTIILNVLDWIACLFVAFLVL
jgi:hypothetical protein